jgi:membrane protease YdiL (CAAX protease family)
MTLFGVFELVLLGVLCFLFYYPSSESFLSTRPVKAVLGLLFGVCALLLGSHKLPGFKNWLILQDWVVSPGVSPVQWYLNFDKPWIGIYIMAFGLQPASTFKQWRRIFQVAIPIAFLTAGTLLGLAWLTGYVRVDFKWFEFSWLWLLTNLLFVCVAEEAFFRGFLTKRGQAPFGTAVLFGLAHWSGGWTYVGLATVAGLFYGYAYLKAQRIEASILVHFIVNAAHFLALSYPALNHSPIR